MLLIACGKCKTQYDATRWTQPEVRCACGQTVRVRVNVPVARPICRCASCGGPLATDAQSCGYCAAQVERDARALTLICPECFAQNPEVSRFCRGCGVAIRPRQPGEKQGDLVCPCCTKGLFPREISGAQVHECADCHGMWIPNEQFRALLDRAVANAAAGRVPIGKPAHAFGRVQYRLCPVCGVQMSRRNYERVSGVVIDECPAHGRWLDQHELEGIVRFLAGGDGVRVARAQKQIKELHGEMRQLASERSDVDQLRPPGRSLLRDLIDLLGD